LCVCPKEAEENCAHDNEKEKTGYSCVNIHTKSKKKKKAHTNKMEKPNSKYVWSVNGKKCGKPRNSSPQRTRTHNSVFQRTGTTARKNNSKKKKTANKTEKEN
jgi:hypothetical protein